MAPDDRTDGWTEELTDTAADTIFALSSGSPPAAIAVIRISGPQAGEVLRALAGRVPEPRRAVLASLRDPLSRGLLDRALLLWFPGPASATGEDLAELHLHGGRAVVGAVEDVLAAQPGLRRAEPGEFTRRGFQNGRMDLAEAEGLADLLAAETEGQRRNAIALAEGALSRSVEGWRQRLLMLSARIEAALDFADEDDVPAVDARWLSEAEGVAAEMAAQRAQPPAERLRDGVRVVLAGPPNSGKSTLFNRLAGREAAITSPLAGTTRDLIEAPVAIAGVPFLLIDTAGLRESTDSIEEIGVARAQAALAAADIVLWLGAPEDAPDGAVRVSARSDIAAPDSGVADVVLSAVTGEGMDALIALLLARGRALLPGEGELALNARQSAALDEAIDALVLARGVEDTLIAAEALRLARAALDRLTGRSGVEDMLDALFGRFCIGK